MKTKHTLYLDCLNPDMDQRRVYVSHDTLYQILIKENPQQGEVILTTDKGTYNIPFDEILNLYQGIANKVKINISLSYTSAKLVYWI